MSTSDSQLSQDVVFDILSSPRRRYTLYYLRTTEGPIKLTDLATQVAAWENEADPDEITDQERKRVYVSLYQTHIPRLDEADIVEYDSDSGLVALTESAYTIDEYLDGPEDGVPWHQIYLLLAGIGAVLLGLTAFDVWVFGAVPEATVLGVVFFGFVLTAVAHYLYNTLYDRSVPEEFQRKL